MPYPGCSRKRINERTWAGEPIARAPISVRIASQVRILSTYSEAGDIPGEKECRWARLIIQGRMSCHRRVVGSTREFRIAEVQSAPKQDLATTQRECRFRIVGRRHWIEV